MVTSVRSALQRVKRQLIVIGLLGVLLNAFLLFAFIAVVLALLHLMWWYAVIPGLIYGFPAGVKRLREVQLSQAEEKIPELEWQLRTTEDTLDQQNEIVESLHQRVLHKLQQLRQRYLMEPKVIVSKFVGGMILVVIAVIFTSYGVTFSSVGSGVTGFFGADQIGAGDEIDEGDLVSVQGERDIYGEEDVAKLGDEELELELEKEKSELDYDQIGELQGKGFSQQPGLGDIGVSADASYTEEIEEEHKKIVKTYFQKLNEET